jgi:hypothetical protein
METTDTTTQVNAVLSKHDLTQYCGEKVHYNAKQQKNQRTGDSENP